MTDGRAIGSGDGRPAVLVLSTLHNYHAEVSCYGFEVFREILSALAPEALFVEVADEHLRARKSESVKREYPEVVYPLLDELPSTTAHALEPSGAVREQLIETMTAAAKVFQAKPEYAKFEVGVYGWWRELVSTWKAAADVNSERTDESVRAKQEFQKPLYPAEYSGAWDEWNQYFLTRIIEVLDRTKPKTAVVLVGVEHSYWLRLRLARRSDLTLIDANATLAALQSARADIAVERITYGARSPLR